MPGTVRAIVGRIGEVCAGRRRFLPGSIIPSRAQLSAWGHAVCDGADPVGIGRVSEVNGLILFEGRFLLRSSREARAAYDRVLRADSRCEWSLACHVADSRHNGPILDVQRAYVWEVSPVDEGASRGTRTLELR